MNENFYPIEFDTAGTRFQIVNNGTAPAPCVITFIPKVDFIKLKIEGLSSEPIFVNNVKLGEVLVIDSENRQVLIDDKDAFDRYDAWEFPKLQPGVNTVRIDNGIQASIQIEYNARYI